MDERDLAELPAVLDEVDRLLAAGVIGGDQPGAADFQIAASVRMLLAMQDVGRLVAGRPSEAFALALIPEYPPIPAALSAALDPAGRGASLRLAGRGREVGGGRGVAGDERLERQLGDRHVDRGGEVRERRQQLERSVR